MRVVEGFVRSTFFVSLVLVGVESRGSYFGAVFTKF